MLQIFLLLPFSEVTCPGYHLIQRFRINTGIVIINLPGYFVISGCKSCLYATLRAFFADYNLDLLFPFSLMPLHKI